MLFSFRCVCNLTMQPELQILEVGSVKVQLSLAILVAPTRVHWGALAICTLARTVLIIVALRRVRGITSALGYQWVPFTCIDRICCSCEKSFHPVIKIW